MQVIQPFKRRIVVEAILKSLLVGLLVACCIELVSVGIAATIYIVSKSAINLFLQFSLIGIPVALGIGAGAAIPTFIISRRKKLKELEHRLDSLGLEERVTTMAEYRHDNSYVAHIQREDTVKKLSQLETKNLKIRVSKRLIMTIAFVLIFALLMPLVVSAIPFDTEQARTETFVDEIIDDLKEIVDDSNLSEEDKEEQKEQIDDFKEKLDEILQDNTLTDEQKKDEIYEEIRKEEDRIEDKLDSDKELIEEIKKEPIFEQLGDKLENNDQKVDKVLDHIKDIIKDPNFSKEEKEEMLEDWKETIDNALQNKEDTPLKDAFEDFKESLDKIQDSLDSPEIEDIIDQEFDKFEENLKDSMEHNKVEQEKVDRLEQAENELVGEENKNIDDVLDDVRDKIEDSNLSQEEKDELNQEVDDLENKLDQIDKDPTLSDEEKTDKKEEAVKDTQDKIEDKLEYEDSYRENISDNIKDWADSDYIDANDTVKENMKDLADAIEKGDKDAVNDALDKIKEDLKQSTDQIKDAGDIGEILDKVTNNQLGEGSEIKEALKDLASDMKDISNKAETDTSQEEIDQDIDNAIDQAKDHLGEALDREGALEDMYDSFDDLREDLIGSTDKTVDDMLEDLRDVINNSNIPHSDKEDLRDIVDDLEQSVKEPGKSDWEISAEISDAKDKINEFIQNSQKENESVGDKLEQTYKPGIDQEAFEQLGEAIKNNDKQGVADALDKIKDSYQNWQGEALEEVLNSTGEAIKDAIEGEDTEVSKELGELADSLIQAGGKAEEDSEQAKSDADQAIEDAKEGLGNALDQTENKGTTGEWMEDILDKGQNSLLGGQEYEKPEKPEPSDQESENNKGEGDQESDKSEEGEGDNTKPPEDNSDSSSGGGGGSVTMGEETFYIPGLGNVKLKDIPMEWFDKEYDKMFGKELSAEQYSAIEAYYASLKASAQ